MVRPSAPSSEAELFDRGQGRGQDRGQDRGQGSAPPPYEEINKSSRLSLDTLDERLRRRSVEKARRRVRNIKIGAAFLVVTLFLMSFM